MGDGGRFDRNVSSDLEARRRSVVDAPWTWLRQVHRDGVVTVVAPGDRAGEEADAAVTDRPGCPIVVLTADCAPVALASDEGVVAVSHVGWGGLVAGVVERTVDVMRATGATDVRAHLGPCIRSECYEFGAVDLDRVANRFGDYVRATTSRGRPALDLPAAVGAALGEVGVDQIDDVGHCTACSPGFFSWRARRDTERQATVVWR